MKAAVLVELKAPLEIAELALPALGVGQVLVRIRWSGICGTQLNEIEGAKGPDKFLPHLLGHEASGFVEDVGPGVTRVRPGDRVVLHWKAAAGIQSATPEYRWNGRKVNAGWVTTFNDMAVVSENRVTPLPPDADMRTATLYGCALTTAFGVINHDAGVRLGESVVVLGSGGVGLAEVLGAHLAGAHPIVAVDVQADKLALARRYGATHAINSREVDLREALREAVGPAGADVTLENTGLPDLMQAAWDITGPKGRIVLVGVNRHTARLAIDPMPLHFGKVLTGSFGGGTVPSDDIPRYMRMERDGRFDLKPMLSHTFSLERINDALEAMRRGEVVRCQIDMEA